MSIITRRRLVWAHTVLIASLAYTSDAPGQVLSPNSELGPYVQQALVRHEGNTDASFGQRLALAGDVLLVAGPGVVHVFERTPGADAWAEMPPLLPAGGADGFGRAVAFDGETAIVGAVGAAYLFRRTAAGFLQSTVLVPDDGDVAFGRAVDVDGDHAAVMGLLTASIFERDPNDPERWTQAAILAARFGQFADVGISKDTAVLVSVNPLVVGGSSETYFFRRDAGGEGRWGLVRSIGPHLLTTVAAIDDTTAVTGGGDGLAFARISSRHLGGVNAWGVEDIAFGNTAFPGASVSGNSIVLGELPGNQVQLLARHQGYFRDSPSGPEYHPHWGAVAYLRTAPFVPPGGTSFGASGVAISGDTVAVAWLGRSAQPTPEDNAILILVSDVDRDGLRDGVDPCLRDPLNNVGGGCQRETTTSPVFDESITLGEVETLSEDQDFVIRATFTNSGAAAIHNPFFEVIELTGGNELVNTDHGPGGLGATLSPDVGDGVWSPGESTTVDFVIRLATRDPFMFRVTVRGFAAQEDAVASN